MADCAAVAAPLSSPAPSAPRCAAAGLDSGTAAELLASMPSRAQWIACRGSRCAWDLPGIGCTCGRGQLGHDFDLHVAVLQLPLVILLEQHRADQPDDRGFIGEDADN